jgi:membrane-bound lytic murein transglycosylase D
MKILWTLSIQLLFAVASFADAPNEANSTQITLDMTGDKMGFDNYSHLPAYNKSDIEVRLMETKCLVQPRFDSEVEAYLRSYLTYGYRDAEQILGRTTLYFPMIEHYLTVNNLPQELKFLPIIESSLRPYATSTAGAAGLWQFMPGTAKDNGLVVNQDVDERRDPYKSTLAALNLLGDLYQYYGTWELALSAYNCGKGNVNRAIRNAGGSYDYDQVSRFLPRETRKYIPRFIAAAYMAQNYFVHGLQPDWPDFDRQWTRTTKVFKYTTFKRIVERTGVNYRILKELNPSYRRNFIPSSTTGNYLILPEMAMIAFQNWQEAQRPANRFAKWSQEDYYKSSYTILAGDSMEKLANLYNCSVYQIMEWNDLSSTDLYYRQELTLFHKKEKGWGLFRA